MKNIKFLGGIGFEEIYMNYVWGGRNLDQMLGKKLPNEGEFAESWEITCREEGVSKVKYGFGVLDGQKRDLCGLDLKELIEISAVDLLGKRSVEKYGAMFPLLIKFLDVSKAFSVQVHPNNEQASELEGVPMGKTESWYTVWAGREGRLVYGLRNGVGREEFRELVEAGKTEEGLNIVSAVKGDFFHMDAGKVHAGLGGLLIYEVQQNSNTTYRIFDWNRVGLDGKPRELHIDKAIKVINFENGGESKNNNTDEQNRVLTKNEYYTMVEKKISDGWKYVGDGESFRVLTVVEGEGAMAGDGGEIKIGKGKTLLLPAQQGLEIDFLGEMTVVLTNV